jgi:hypothetical protein
MFYCLSKEKEEMSILPRRLHAESGISVMLATLMSRESRSTAMAAGLEEGDYCVSAILYLLGCMQSVTGFVTFE